MGKPKLLKSTSGRERPRRVQYSTIDFTDHNGASGRTLPCTKKDCPMTTCHLLQKIAAVGILLSSVAVSVSAQDAPAENDYYQMDSFKLPEGLVLEIGGIEWFNEKLAISTRRGDIYMRN